MKAVGLAGRGGPRTLGDMSYQDDLLLGLPLLHLLVRELDRLAESFHHLVLTAEVVLVGRVLIPSLKPFERALTGGEQLFLDGVVDAQILVYERGLGQPGSPDVLTGGAVAASVELEVLALAGGAKSEFDLVDACEVVLTRNEPDAVTEPDFFGVLLVKGDSAKFAGCVFVAFCLRWVR